MGFHAQHHQKIRTKEQAFNPDGIHSQKFIYIYVLCLN